MKIFTPLCVIQTSRWGGGDTPTKRVNKNCANTLSAYNRFWQIVLIVKLNSSKRGIFGFAQKVTRSLLAFSWPWLIPIDVRQALTLQCSRRHYVLVHVIHVVGQEVLGCAAAAHEAGVQVEGGGQRGQAWVIYQCEACQNLDLLPAMESLSQSCGYLTQSLPGEKEIQI